MPITWQADLIAADQQPQAPLLRTAFALLAGHGGLRSATLHVTALGVVEPVLDGSPVGEDLLTPGWSSYEWRLRYRSHDVTAALAGEGEDGGGQHVLGLALGNGWANGRLGWGDGGHYYSREPAALAQLELTYADGHQQVVVTDGSWQAHSSAVLADDLYDGQTIDARLLDPAWATADGLGQQEGWGGVHVVDLDPARLVEHLGPPVRRQESIAARRVWRSPSGRLLADFGQNLVGWLRLRVQAEAGSTVTVRHAEVLEDGELGVRPLRTAKATDRFVLSGGQDVFEPTFTFHGFRYVEIEGWPGEDPAPEDLQAVVIGSQLRRTGEFECSHELLNQLHRNVVWGQRGNFVDVPTDCPQRDERLGWTGDLAAFGPTAVYLFDTRDFLQDWLRDLDAEQSHHDGLVPYVVPDVMKYWPERAERGPIDTTAVWSDVAAWLPWDMWLAYGDRDALAEAYPSMVAHVARVEAKLSPQNLWDTGFQFADWLDPDAPPDRPGDAKADKGVVATACAHRSARTVARAAQVLGRDEDAARFTALADRVREGFRSAYVSPDGKVTSDCATAYALALRFGLLDGETEQEERLRALAGERLAELVAKAGYRVSTGFAGTPYVTDALADTGHLEDAYRLLLEEGCPSWLYPVTMGATTVWERWDSMLPDGSINPGQMTSFNHYALGAVADWMHRTVAGLAPLEPGYARALVAPRPGGGLRWARTSLDSPHGRWSVRWEVDGEQLQLEVDVPDGASALVRLPGAGDQEVTAGSHVLRAALQTGSGPGLDPV